MHTASRTLTSTGLAVAAHVVVHEGRTALFADGSGAIQIMDSAAFSESEEADDEVEHHASEAAHHGVAVEEGYQRSGNRFRTHDSPVVLADHKTDPDAEQERPARIGLIDTCTDSIRTVDVGTACWFRSLARGPEGEVLVLTYDGQLAVLDEQTGESPNEIAVVTGDPESPATAEDGHEDHDHNHNAHTDHEGNDH